MLTMKNALYKFQLLLLLLYARFACFLNSVCCGSILQSSRLRILALLHLISLEMFTKIKDRKNRVCCCWPETSFKVIRAYSSMPCDI